MAGNSGAIRAGRAFVALYADNTQLARDLKAGVAMMRRFAASARAVGASMISAGLKLGTPFAIATAIFVGFEDQMAEVRAVTQASAADFSMLNDQAKTLGRTTSFMAKEVAGAQTELGRAGFNPSEIMAGTAAILDLARGTKTDLAQAAQIGADSLRAFRLEAEQMPMVADVLVATANNSSQGLIDLFEALKTVGPVAADVGASISDTAAAIGVLANNGIKGTLAGNALKRAYLNLANPAIQKAIKELTNVSSVDAAGNLRPLATVITEIGRATKSLPNAKRLDIFSQIFGDRAVVAASAFAGSAGNFKDLQGILDGAAGTAARTAAIMDDTLGGSFRMLLSAAEGAAIAVGESIAPAVRSLAEIFTRAAGNVTAFVKENQGLVIGLAATAVGAVAVGSSLVAIGGTLGVLAFSFSSLIPLIAGSIGIIPRLIKGIYSPARLATSAVGKLIKTGSKLGVNSAKPGPASRGAVSASTALTRTTGRTSGGLLTMGRSANLLSKDLIFLTRVSTRTSVGLLTVGRSAQRSSLRLNGLTGSMKRAAIATKATMGMKSVGTAAKVAGTAISGALSGLMKLASNPVVLLGALAAGVASAALYATGSFDVIKDGFMSLVSWVIKASGRMGTQASNAWRAVSTVAVRAFGSIVERVKAGDMAGAFKVATTAMKLAWSELVLAFADSWAPVKQALVSGWQDTAKLLADIFGPAVGYLKETFAGFAEWFRSDSGVGSLPETMADAVANLAEIFATGWSVMKSSTADVLDVLSDGFDTFYTSISNGWSEVIADMQAGWLEMKRLAGADIDMQAEIKNINDATNAGNETRNNERDKAINDRAAASKAAKEKAKTELAEQLKTINETRVAKNKADKEAIAASKKAAEEEAKAKRAAFESALAASIPSPLDAAATTGAPAAAAAAQTATGTPTPTMSSTVALAEWKKKRDRRDQLTDEMKGANENGGLNPYTSRNKKVIKEELATAAVETNLAMERVRQARGEEVKAAKRPGKNKEMEAAKSLDLAKKAETTAGATSGLDRIQSRLGDSVGTFSARAGGQLGAASTVMDRVAKAVEKTADAAETTATNTERTAKAVEDLANLESE
jgi:TP901 family phage tail tape measure protein